MGAILQKLGWKKLAIIIVVLALFMLGYAIFSLLNIDHPQNSKNGKANESTDSKNDSKNSLKGKFSVDTPSDYSNRYYSIEYPNYYNVEDIPQSDSLSFMKLTDNAGNAKIEITVVDSKTNPIEKMERAYIGEMYEPESYPIGGQNVDEFFKIDPASGRLLQKVFFIQKEGKIIKVDFTYTSTEPNYDLERDLIRIISSLK